jgi:hypothetical protein
VDFPESADKTVLNEIVCRDRIARNGARVTPQDAL